MSFLDDLMPKEATPPSPTQPQAAPQSTPQGSPLDALIAQQPQHDLGDAGGEMGWGDTGIDVAKSAGIGVPKGLIAGAGFPGDLQSMAGSDYNPFNWLARKYEEANPERAAKNRANAERAGIGEGMMGDTKLPTSHDIQSGIEGVTGEFYKPKTALGNIAEKTTEFAANPISYAGPGGVGLKAATAGMAGAGSEAAGQATESLTGEGPLATGARIVGAVAAGKIPHSVAQAQFRNAMKNAASTEELFDTADNLYDLSRTNGVMIKPQALQDLGKKIRSDLSGEGFRERNVPAAWKAIDELDEAINSHGLSGIADIHSVRKVLNKVASSTPANAAQEREAARYAVAEINKYMGSVPTADIAVGTPDMVKRAVSDWRNADRSYSAGMRAEQLEDALKDAVTNTGQSGKGGNLENNLRKALGNIAKSKVKSRGFTSDELSTMREIAKGGKGTNILRGIGALAPTGIVSGGIGMEIGHLLFGGLKGAVGLPLVGLGAKWMAEHKTENAFEDLISRVRMRGSAATPPTPPPSAMPKGSLSTLLGQARGGAIDRARRMSKAN